MGRKKLEEEEKTEIFLPSLLAAAAAAEVSRSSAFGEEVRH